MERAYCMQKTSSDKWQKYFKTTFVIAISITLAAIFVNITFLLSVWVLNIPSPIFSSQTYSSVSVIACGVISIFVGVIAFMKFNKYFSQIV